jgi:hypothetical protein
MAEQETDPDETDTEHEEQGLLARIKGLLSRS